MPQLKLNDLVTGLVGRTNRYTELVVFADDLAEVAQLRIGELPLELTPLDHAGVHFSFGDRGQVFKLEVSEDGVARLSKMVEGTEKRRAVLQDEAPHGAVPSAALRTAVAKKGDGWAAGLVLGLLVGPAIAGSQRSRRVLTVRFHGGDRTWKAYDGGLVRWMKRELQPSR
jgi:hypothetical protein